MPLPQLVAPITLNLLPLDSLGPHVDQQTGEARFGVLLPLVGDQTDYELWVRLIHEEDQFLKAVPPQDFPLPRAADLSYGSYWSGTVSITPATSTNPNSHWGQPGRYVYRFVLKRPDGSDRLDWIIDPFAREFGVGKLSAFTLGYEDFQWDQAEDGWKVPDARDLVIYELMISEFGGSLEGTIAHLDYLADLGANCIEIMPLSHTSAVVDWGYMPTGYFGADERFGKRRDVQRLVQEAHRRGLAVIVDAVYGHTDSSFPYAYVYQHLGLPSPFIGPFSTDMFGESTDFGEQFTRDFFFTVNHFWMDRLHIDGFRYDCVPEYWDGCLGQGYASLVYNTYHLVKQMAGSGPWQRFAGKGLNLIQCGEQLERPEEVTWTTYSSSVWQDQTRGEAVAVATASAQEKPGALARLGLRLGLSGYPEEVTVNNDTITKAPLQYFDNHDHERFICHFGWDDPNLDALLRGGDRTRWYKLQPYLIGLFTAKGAPLLWQGMELCENYSVPGGGEGRVRIFRPMRWEYFYDEAGKHTIALIRRLAALRRTGSQFRRGDHYFYNHHDHYQSKAVLLFSRQDASAFSLVALNFGDADQTVPFTFPVAGDFQEELHGLDSLMGVQAGETRHLAIPSNYGRVWTRG
jgi:maltooligosyltrehalose trehalohydrolase